MTPSEIYAIATGSILVVLLVFRLCFTSAIFLANFLRTHDCRRFLRSHLIVRHKWIGPLTTSQAGVASLFVGGTIVANAVNVGSVVEAAQRSATLAVINLTPLCLGAHLSFVSTVLGISIETVHFLHVLIGWMCIWEGAVHMLLSLAASQWSFTASGMQLYGIIAIASFGGIVASALLRRVVYELALKLHTVSVVIAVCCLWYHIQPQAQARNLYLAIASGTLIIGLSLHFLRVVYRNVGLFSGSGVSQARADVRALRGATRVRVSLRRGWKIRGGQYVQLYMPILSRWTFLQTHPLMICWWDEIDGVAHSIYFLIEPRLGFSHRIHHNEPPRSFLIDGPLGSPPDFRIYGTIVMFATGIGVAAQLPCVKDALQASNAFEGLTRKLHLIWEVETSDQYDWVRRWMDDLLREDKHYKILQISVYHVACHASMPAVEYRGDHQRLGLYASTLDVEELLCEEISKRRGTLLVTASARASIRDSIRAIVQKANDGQIEMHEMAFQPVG